MWKLLLIISAFAGLLAGCASSDSKQKSGNHKAYDNLIELRAPQQAAAEPGKVYIDSVKQITTDTTQGVLISGHLADGCTHLKSISHRIKKDSLWLDIQAWRRTDILCTQALVPFAYIYDQLSAQELNNHSHITIQGKTYSF